MEQIFTSFSRSDLQDLIAGTVNACLKVHYNKIATTDPDELLTVQQAASFLSLAVPTIYGLISRNEISNLKKGKRVYFIRQDLINWLKESRRKTNAEIAEENDTYLLTQKKGGK